MRIPGTRTLENKLILWFEINDSDKRVLRRGYRDIIGTSLGLISGILSEGGNPFNSWKGILITIGVSAITVMYGKYNRETNENNSFNSQRS